MEWQLEKPVLWIQKFSLANLLLLCQPGRSSFMHSGSRSREELQVKQAYVFLLWGHLPASCTTDLST